MRQYPQESKAQGHVNLAVIMRKHPSAIQFIILTIAFMERRWKEGQIKQIHVWVFRWFLKERKEVLVST